MPRRDPPSLMKRRVEYSQYVGSCRKLRLEPLTFGEFCFSLRENDRAEFWGNCSSSRNITRSRQNRAVGPSVCL